MSCHEEFANGLYRQNWDFIAKGWTKATNSPTSITAQVEMFTVSRADEHRLRRLVQESILESLDYPAMSNRYESLPEAHPKSFEWAFSKSIHGDVPWTNLATWFKT